MDGASPPRIRYADPEPTGLAAIVGGVLEGNLRADPSRARHLRPATVRVEARDLGLAVRLDLRPDGVLVASDPARDGGELTISAEAARLVELVGAPLRLGLPDPLHPGGRRVLAAILRREIRIRGALRHPLALVRLARLLSVS